jgi:hypothetical protein
VRASRIDTFRDCRIEASKYTKPITMAAIAHHNNIGCILASFAIPLYIHMKNKYFRIKREDMSSTSTLMDAVRQRMLNKGISTTTAASNSSSIYTALWSDPKKLEYICNIISVLYTYISSATDTKNVKLYMKGGNSIPLLKHKYGFIEPPLVFPSDFDLTVLVNPGLGKAEYDKIQAFVLNACLAFTAEFCMTESYVDIFEPVAAAANPIRFHTIEGMFSTDLYPNSELNRVFDKFRTLELPPTCPFEIYIRPNTVFEHRIIDVGMIALRLRTSHGAPIELFDISFTLWNSDANASSRKNVVRDWALTKFISYNTPLLYISVYDPFSAYLDMHIAARRNTRTNKRRRRLERAANLNATFHITNNITLKNRRAEAYTVLQKEENVRNIF